MNTNRNAKITIIQFAAFRDMLKAGRPTPLVPLLAPADRPSRLPGIPSADLDGRTITN